MGKKKKKLKLGNGERRSKPYITHLKMNRKAGKLLKHSTTLHTHTHTHTRCSDVFRNSVIGSRKLRS